MPGSWEGNACHFHMIIAFTANFDYLIIYCIELYYHLLGDMDNTNNIRDFSSNKKVIRMGNERRGAPLRDFLIDCCKADVDPVWRSLKSSTTVADQVKRGTCVVCTFPKRWKPNTHAVSLYLYINVKERSDIGILLRPQSVWNVNPAGNLRW